MADTIEQLYKNTDLTDKLYPVTKESAVTDTNDVTLDTKLSTMSSAMTKSVNGNFPDANGNVAVPIPNLTAGTGIDITNEIVTNTALNASLRYLNGNTYDLDEIMEEGIYQCYNCSNIPSGTNGVLIVIKVSSSGTYRQIFFRQGTINTNDFYWYSRQITSSSKGDWVQIYNAKSLVAGDGIDISDGTITNAFTILADGADLNDVSYNYQGYAANAVTSKPTTTGGGFASFFAKDSGGTFNQHGFQLFNVYSADRLFFRRKNGTAWGTWTELATHYKANNTVTLSTWYEVHGLCGATATTLYFTFPLSKPIDENVTSVTFTTLKLAVYSNGTRVLSSTNVIGGSYGVTATLDKNTNSISVTVTSLPTMTKNMPVAVEIASGTSFTFN